MEVGPGMSVVLQGVTKRFTVAGTPAVSRVSFEAPRGAVTALLGPSGAGKSTVLRLVAGLEAPDEGRILIEGEDCSRVPVQKRGVGLVFQSYALFEHMTVRENVAFGLSVRKRPREEIVERVGELLELVQLEALAARYPAQLSGGQRQRVAFARALAVRPKVLLLDEPFGALDAQVRRELREWLDQLHADTGVTTLLVTHDQAEALELAEHVVVMFDGHVAQAGSPEDVYDRPLSPRIASFVGGANLLQAPARAGHVARGREAAQMFVRPHDVKLGSANGNEPGFATARIDRMKRIGGTVRLSLTLEGGEAVTMEASASAVEALGAGDGDLVSVDLRAARLFGTHGRPANDAASEAELPSEA
jgi:sulfate transport system ATP-binding protein